MRTECSHEAPITTAIGSSPRACGSSTHAQKRSNHSPLHHPSSTPVGKKIHGCLSLLCAEHSRLVDWADTSMIIDPESHIRKTQLGTGQEPVATASTPLVPNESPPAYTPREDFAASSSSAPPYHNPSSLPETQKRPPDRAAKRFFKALILALCLYAAIALTLKFLFFFTMSGPPHGVR